jgi:ATP-dependent HslUV protease, peptidase subunit HslV
MEGSSGFFSIAGLRAGPDPLSSRPAALAGDQAVDRLVAGRFAVDDRAPVAGVRQGSHIPCMEHYHGTTILGVKKDGKTVIAGDGQVSLGNTVIKPNAKKVRRIGEDGKVIGGFAGATADAFTLFERLERKLEQYNGQLMRSAVELAKDWRTDKYLRNLEAMMIVADRDSLLILTGNGDVLEPEGGIAAIGSGGNYALAAARALTDYEQDPEALARRAMKIAAEVCVFTNDQLTIETIEA